MMYEKSAVAAAKLIAQHEGVSGKVGGWLYTQHGEPICQGWADYAKRMTARGVIRPKQVIDPKTGKTTTRYAINWRRLRRPM